MSAQTLAYAEQRMQQKWHDLVMEEQKGTAQPVLERMFHAYMLAVEEYNRCLVEEQELAAPTPLPAQQGSIRKAS